MFCWPKAALQVFIADASRVSTGQIFMMFFDASDNRGID